ATVSADGTGLVYQLTDGPTGFPTSSNSTGIFNSLTAGSYTVQVTDGCSASTTSNFVVANTYPAYSVDVVEVVPGTLCGDFILGAELTGNVIGGKSPYQYDFVKIVNGTPVSPPSYSTPTSATSYNEVVPEFGIYRFYALDACGEVRTKDVNAIAAQPQPVSIPLSENFILRPCAETLNGVSTTGLYIRLQDANGVLINWANVAGTTINLYEPVSPLTSTSFNCSTDTTAGPAIATYTISPTDNSIDYLLVMPQQDVIAIIRTPCGNVLKYCIHFTSLPAINSSSSISYGQSCGATWADQTFSVNYVALNTTLPLNLTITTSSGNNNQTTTINVNNGYVFTGFNFADFPITFDMIDACGRTGQYIVQAPTSGQGDPVTATTTPTWICSAQEGTTQVFLSDIHGDIPGRIEASLSVTGGPVWAVPQISSANNVNVVVSNLVPGYTYTVTWTNTCGGTSTFDFTVPTGGYPSYPPISNNITVTNDALCGQNISNVLALANSNVNFGTKTFCLINTGTNTQFGCNTSGAFANVPPGDYLVKWTTTWNGSTAYCPAEYISDST
ncbi:MAG TPA: hypothetical protein PK230_10795, partial [Chitinophagales bacterium]|nr:hypothetical protein [Chitinophagales bacterium]